VSANLRRRAATIQSFPDADLNELWRATASLMAQGDFSLDWAELLDAHPEIAP